MTRFENYLNDNLYNIDTFHPIYNQSLNDMLNAGGKRFRPMLLLNIVDAYESMLYDGALPVALALEMFHTYSLIHDDLPAMDDASLRRGHTTLHIKYDEATAVLAGDGLNSDAFYMISSSPLRDDIKIKLITQLSLDGGSRGMVLGQAIDCYFEKTTLPIESVKILHKNKTAKLIASSMKMGAIIVGLDDKTQSNIYNFGIDLGLLFQIQDDILDITQSTQEAGKTTGIDGDKNSFVTLLGLEKAIEEADILSKDLYDRFLLFDTPLQKALSFIVEKYLNRHK